ncbi:hypothetical protein IFM89_001380, partial [Coptis chinensis]
APEGITAAKVTAEGVNEQITVVNLSLEDDSEKLSLDGVKENSYKEGAEVIAAVAKTKEVYDQVGGRIEKSVVEHELSPQAIGEVADTALYETEASLEELCVAKEIATLADNGAKRCKILQRKFSDYSPVMGWCNKNTRPDNVPFQFRKIWLEHNQFMNMVKLSWSEPMSDGHICLVMRKLKRLKSTLKAWHKNTYWALEIKSPRQRNPSKTSKNIKSRSLLMSSCIYKKWKRKNSSQISCTLKPLCGNKEHAPKRSLKGILTLLISKLKHEFSNPNILLRRSRQLKELYCMTKVLSRSTWYKPTKSSLKPSRYCRTRSF